MTIAWEVFLLFVAWLAWEGTRDYIDRRDIRALADEQDTDDVVAWLRSIREDR